MNINLRERIKKQVRQKYSTAESWCILHGVLKSLLQ